MKQKRALIWKSYVKGTQQITCSLYVAIVITFFSVAYLYGYQQVMNNMV